MSNFKARLTGYNPTGGGVDADGQPVGSSIPGGGGIGGAAQIGAGIFDLLYADDIYKEQEGAFKQAGASYDKFRSTLGNQSFDVSQAVRDLAARGIRETDTSGIDANLATVLGNMNDPRAFANVNSLLTATNQAKQQQKIADIARGDALMQPLVDAEQANLEKKQDLQTQLGMFDMQQALADRTQAAQNMQDARAAKRDAFGNIVGGVTNLATSFLTPLAEDGGAVEALLRKGNVVKTNGEFDHDTNKKALIDEKTGEKEAELTGGEYVLNPEQGEEIHMAYRGIEQILRSGEEPTMDQLMALFQAVQTVFSQPQFNEEE